MTFQGWFQIVLFMAVVFAVTKPLGVYMHRVFETDAPPLGRVLQPVERFLLRLCGVSSKSPEDQTWLGYTAAFLAFNLLGVLVTYAIQRTQAFLPLNPRSLAG